jgi:hypothetical protein
VQIQKGRDLQRITVAKNNCLLKKYRLDRKPHPPESDTTHREGTRTQEI